MYLGDVRNQPPAAMVSGTARKQMLTVVACVTPNVLSVIPAESELTVPVMSAAVESVQMLQLAGMVSEMAQRQT